MVIVAQGIATLPTPFSSACGLKSKAMGFSAPPWSVLNFSSSTPTMTAVKVCARGGARL